MTLLSTEPRPYPIPIAAGSMFRLSGLRHPFPFGAGAEQNLQICSVRYWNSSGTAVDRRSLIIDRHAGAKRCPSGRAAHMGVGPTRRAVELKGTRACLIATGAA